LAASSLAQVFGSFLPPLSTVENLYIYKHQYLQSDWQDNDIENTHWLGLLRPFTTVKSLYLWELSAPRIAPALQEPILQNISLEGLQPSGPVRYATALQSSYSRFRLGKNVVGGRRLTSALLCILSHQCSVSSIYHPPHSF
jgi:hypothetical protein